MNEQPKGLRCPMCSGELKIVKDSRDISFGRRRVRVCRSCEGHVTTVELVHSKADSTRTLDAEGMVGAKSYRRGISDAIAALSRLLEAGT